MEAVGARRRCTRHGKLPRNEGSYLAAALESEANRVAQTRSVVFIQPIFKWNSATPWSEMQLAPWNVPDSSTFLQLVKKGYAKLMWAIILSRVLGYCVKNYYMVNRQAVKRITKYAGKHSAFSAELATAEMLKSQKK
jgi:hypothetical protein